MMYKSVHFPQEMTRGVTAFIPFHIPNNSPYHPFILILHIVILFHPSCYSKLQVGFSVYDLSKLLRETQIEARHQNFFIWVI